MKASTLLVPSQGRLPIVASIPHCGTRVPDDVRRQFRQAPHPVLTGQDWHLDKLYDFLPDLGISLLHANYSRYVVDLERDPAAPHFGAFMSSIVHEDTTMGRPLYETPPTESEVERRIAEYYVPYHERLAELVDATVTELGRAFLLDLHSFFGHPFVSEDKITTEVELGNRHGTTSSKHFIGCFEDAFRERGFRVASNNLWRGGYIPQHYGSLDNVEGLSIEIRFPVYLDRDYFGEEEVTEWDSTRFRAAKGRLREVFADAIGGLLRD